MSCFDEVAANSFFKATVYGSPNSNLDIRYCCIREKKRRSDEEAINIALIHTSKSFNGAK